jgi:hypothetical protein
MAIGVAHAVPDRSAALHDVLGLVFETWLLDKAPGCPGIL